MKKFFWLIFLFPFMTHVSAQVYYTDYSDFSPYQEEEVLENDTTFVESELWYHLYQEKKVIGSYYTPVNDTELFTDDCKTTYSQWIQGTTPFTNIETKVEYTNKMSKPVRYIHFTNLQGSYSAIRITEIDVYVNGTSIDYGFTCQGCWENFGKYIHNGIWAENESYIDNGGSLTLDLKQEYPAHKIEIVFYIFDIGDEIKKYTIQYSQDGVNTFGPYSQAINFSEHGFQNAKKFTYNVYQLGNENSWIYSLNTSYLVQNDFLISYDAKEYYRYIYQDCKPYTIEKEYGNYAPNETEEYPYKDEDDVKTKYRYKTRDKIEIDSNLTISSYDSTIQDLILSSTTDFEIIGDIDKNKNGEYPILVQMKELSIPITVTVNIPENTIRDYQEKVIELQNQIQALQDEYAQKLSDLENQKELEQKEIQEKYDQTILEYSNQLNALQTKLKELEEELSTTKEDKIKFEEKIIELQNQIKTLNDSLSDAYQNYQNQSEIESQSKQELQKNIDYLNGLNQAYYDKIQELSNSVNQANTNLKEVIIHEQELVDYYENEILKYKKTIEQLQDNTNSDEKCEKKYAELKNQIQEETLEKENLTNTANQYLLQIQNQRKTVIISFIFLVILFLIYLFTTYVMRKKSNEKND